jgi:hypothetical protein
MRLVRSRGIAPLLACVLLSWPLAVSSAPAKKKTDKAPPPATPTAAPEVPPPAPAPAKAAAPSDPAAAAPAAPEAKPASSSKPAPNSKPVPSSKPAPVEPERAVEEAPARQAPVSYDVVPVPADVAPAVTASRASFEGFFFSLNFGYATAGGQDGPIIPMLTHGGAAPPPGTPDLAAYAGSGDAYKRIVTTNRGEGVGAGLQFGYNIKGVVSLALDLTWHGSFGSKTDTAGNGTVAGLLGLHPLRFWRHDLPVDVKLYGGYGFFDILYYYEADIQTEAKGKAWTGTALPFGVQTEYRFDPKGVFALGLDLRAVQGAYTKWIYNYDNDITSNPATPVETFRKEARLTFGWHF